MPKAKKALGVAQFVEDKALNTDKKKKSSEDAVLSRLQVPRIRTGWTQETPKLPGLAILSEDM
jgi:hypothetical protein